MKWKNRVNTEESVIIEYEAKELIKDEKERIVQGQNNENNIPEVENENLVNDVLEAEHQKPTFIAKGTIFTGNIMSTTALWIEGEINGNVNCKSVLNVSGQICGDMECDTAILTNCSVIGNVQCNDTMKILGETHLKGNINAKNILNEGVIEGNVTALECVEIKSHATICGDMSAKSIEVASGATIKGNLMISQEQ